MTIYTHVVEHWLDGCYCQGQIKVFGDRKLYAIMWPSPPLPFHHPITHWRSQGIIPRKFLKLQMPIG